jgi:hypothetical protein
MTTVRLEFDTFEEAAAAHTAVASAQGCKRVSYAHGAWEVQSVDALIQFRVKTKQEPTEPLMSCSCQHASTT